MMKKIKKDNTGFSLVELIIVVAILAVLVGIVAPQWLKYLERSRRVTDVTVSKQICDACMRLAATENVDYFDPSRGVHVGSIGIGPGTRMPTTASTYADAVIMELGKVPISATDKRLYWFVEFDWTVDEGRTSPTGSVKRIYLALNPSAKQYELYPDPSEFLKNGVN